jgi:hypothetical protein
LLQPPVGAVGELRKSGDFLNEKTVMGVDFSSFFSTPHLKHCSWVHVVYLIAGVARGLRFAASCAPSDDSSTTLHSILSGEPWWTNLRPGSDGRKFLEAYFDVFDLVAGRAAAEQGKMEKADDEAAGNGRRSTEKSSPITPWNVVTLRVLQTVCASPT